MVKRDLTGLIIMSGSFPISPLGSMGNMAMLHNDLKNLKHSITSTNLKCTGEGGGGSNCRHCYKISIN